MKAVVQRVKQAAVEVDGTEIGRIGSGLLVFLGVAKGDGEADSRFMIDKISGLRIFNDPQGKMNRSLKDTEGSALVISQLTLLGGTTKGRRPGFDQAAPPEVARSLYGPGHCRASETRDHDRERPVRRPYAGLAEERRAGDIHSR